MLSKPNQNQLHVHKTSTVIAKKKSNMCGLQDSGYFFTSPQHWFYSCWNISVDKVSGDGKLPIPRNNIHEV